MRVKTAATAVRSGSSASVRAWTSVVRVAQAAPAKKKPTSAAEGQRGDQPGGERGVDQQLQRAQGQRRVHRADQGGHRREHGDHHDRQPSRRRSRTGRRAGRWRRSRSAAAVRRSRSRSGPDCGARLRRERARRREDARAERRARLARRPRRATATASGAGTVTAKRTTSRQGTGGGVVRTSSSSQAGARRPRSRRTALRHAQSLSPAAGASICARRDTVRRLTYSPEPCPCPCARSSPPSTPATTPRSPRAGTPSGWSAAIRTSRCGRVLFAVDPTSAVVDEVIETGADLLVTHHPLLLTPVHGVPADDPKGRLVHRLIRAGRRRCSSRTPTPTGPPTTGSTTRWPPSSGWPTPCRWSRPPADPRAGLGRVGELAQPMTLREFAAPRRRRPARDRRRRAGGGGPGPAVAPGRRVRRQRRIAAAAAAAAAGADVLLTSDLKHHPVSEAAEIAGPALCRRGPLRDRVALAAGGRRGAATRPVRPGGGGRLAAAHRPVDVASRGQRAGRGGGADASPVG